MKWCKKEEDWHVPVKNWASNLEDGAEKQASNLAKLPCAFHHIALMPDAHSGCGMCIGGVLALRNAVCPSACGVDGGCGVCAIKTNLHKEDFEDMRLRRRFHTTLKELVPVGEAHANREIQEWVGFDEYLDNHGDRANLWPLEIDRKNLKSCGGGNHYLEADYDEEGFVWLQLHSGSRNLGHRICSHYTKIAQMLCDRWFINLPDRDLSFIPTEETEGQHYIDDLNFALSYAKENRRRMMMVMQEVLVSTVGEVKFGEAIDVHHNFTALENHFGENVWVHRKGATRARLGETCIIPGSMGTHTYVCQGLGNPESFMSCSHGAGRKMSRSAASQNLTKEECDKAMEGIVCDRWSKVQRGKCKGQLDLSEAPGAYKDIEEVIANEADLVKPLVRLTPLAVLKG